MTLSQELTCTLYLFDHSLFLDPIFLESSKLAYAYETGYLTYSRFSCCSFREIANDIL